MCESGEHLAHCAQLFMLDELLLRVPEIIERFGELTIACLDLLTRGTNPVGHSVKAVGEHLELSIPLRRDTHVIRSVAQLPDRGGEIVQRNHHSPSQEVREEDRGQRDREGKDYCRVL